MVMVLRKCGERARGARPDGPRLNVYGGRGYLTITLATRRAKVAWADT